MGIPSLLPFLDDAMEDAHISRYTGKKAAIDGYAWLHKAAHTCVNELANGFHTTAHVDYCVNKFKLMRENGVEPVLVLDGAALPAKAATESSRRASRDRHRREANEMLKSNAPGWRDELAKAIDITPEHAHQLILACRRHNIAYYVAPYEADAQLALLARVRLRQQRHLPGTPRAQPAAIHAHAAHA